MCNYKETTFSCGCTASERTQLCGYHDEDFAECMNWTTCDDVSSSKDCPSCTSSTAAPPATPPPAWGLKGSRSPADEWSMRQSPARGVEVA